MQLGGQAATWWRDIRQQPFDLQPQDWNAFADELKRMFMPVNRVKLARDKLATIRQRDNETVAAYTTNIRRLLLTIPSLSEDDKVDRYIRGLQPYLRKETYLSDPATFEQAAQIAAKHESLRLSINTSNTGHWPNINYNHPVPASSHGPGRMELGSVRSRR